MQNIHSFGACLKKILSSRDLSILEASRSLGMKSPTSLARILHDEVNIKTLERFYRQLLDSSAFSITEEEAGLLTKALKIQQLGQDEYLAQQALWRLLLPMEDEPTEDMKIICYHKHPGSRFDTLSQLFSFYQACSRVNLTVTGCCVPAFTLPLARLLKSSKESRHIFATHYLRSHAGASHSMAAALASMRPLLPLFNYSAFLADRATLPPEAMAVYGKNEFLCSFHLWHIT